MRIALLALGVVDLPLIALAGALAGLAVWYAPGLTNKVFWAVAACLALRLALWIFSKGPQEPHPAVFLLASLLNLVRGAGIWMHPELPWSRMIAVVLFLASFWQFWVWRHRKPVVTGPSS